MTTTTTRPTFAAWLRKQRDRQDAVGDLARDAAADPRRLTGPWELYRRIDELGGTPNALNACCAAWSEWEELT